MIKLSILDVVVWVTKVPVVAVTIPVSVAVGIEHVEGSAVVTCVPIVGAHVKCIVCWHNVDVVDRAVRVSGGSAGHV